MRLSLLFVFLALPSCASRRRRYKKGNSKRLADSAFRARHFGGQYFDLADQQPSDVYRGISTPQHFERLVIELQEELDAAQEHLRRFAQMFHEIRDSQPQNASNSPAVDPMKVRPVSQVCSKVALPPALHCTP